jgi:hypothetical protein
VKIRPLVGKDQFVPFVKDKSAKRKVSNIDKLDRKLRALDRIQIRKSYMQSNK